MTGTWWSGLSSSEGHRAVPGWTMAESGDWQRHEMFGLGYVRKPAGMSWAIAASASALGESEWSARAVSALAHASACVCTWWFARRWGFEGMARSGDSGRRGGGWGKWGGWAVGAGLVQGVLPVWWSVSRSAEIEALHHLGVGLAAMCVVDVLVRADARGAGAAESACAGSAQSEHPARAWWGGVGVAAGVAIALLAKGPAGLPVIGAVLVSAAVVRGGPFLRAAAWRGIGPVCAGIAAGAGVFGAAMWWVWQGSQGLRDAALGVSGIRAGDAMRESLGGGTGVGGRDAGGDLGGVGGTVVQGVDEFLWNLDDWPRIATVSAAGFLSGMPLTLAAVLMAVRGGRGKFRGVGTSAADKPRGVRCARALAMGGLAGFVVYQVLGVGNPRYTMPAVAVLGPVWAAVGALGLGGLGLGVRAGARRWDLMGSGGGSGGSGGRWWVWCVILAMAWAVWMPLAERSRAAKSGRTAGIELAASLRDGDVVWADDLIEARPEVLWYAQRRAAEAGRRVRVVWAKGAMAVGGVPAEAEGGRGRVVVVRTDPGSTEWERYRPLVDSGGAKTTAQGSVHKFAFVVVRLGDE